MSSSNILAVSSSSSLSLTGSFSSSSSSPTFNYGTLIDTRDGQAYKTVVIGSQTWMAQNLNFKPTTTPDSSWCYRDSTSYCATYGRLYDHQTALAACPTGWHLPDTTEWNSLEATVGGSSTAGTALMSATGWYLIGGNNTYGFSALPGGYSDGTMFFLANEEGHWWTTATSTYDNSAYYRSMIFNTAYVNQDADFQKLGLSVRCVKNKFESISSSSLVVKISSSSSTILSSSSFDPYNLNISYGILTDFRDGQTYMTVAIGSQTWMAQNLAYLPSVNDSTDSSSTVAKYYVFGYDGTNVSAAQATINDQTYGVIYNYPAALTACPANWHLPDTTEWNDLETDVGGANSAGLALMSATGWVSGGMRGNNISGFSALPGGNYYGTSFRNAGTHSAWWMATADTSSYVYFRNLYYNYAGVFHSFAYPVYGYSVRCLKN